MLSMQLKPTDDATHVQQSPAAAEHSRTSFLITVILALVWQSTCVSDTGARNGCRDSTS